MTVEGSSTAHRKRQVTYDFSDQVVLITGAARGQGRSHALEFSRAGAAVVLLDYAGEPLGSVHYSLPPAEVLDQTAAECRELGAEALVVRADVRDSDQLEAAVAAAIERFGKIDVLVANAGINAWCDVVEMSEQAWDETVDVNLKGVFLTTKHVIPHMIEARSGRIVVTGSVESFGGLPGLAHYTASKHGVAGYVKALALELAPSGIAVNYVCPGAIDTTMAESFDDPRLPPNMGDRLAALAGSFNILEEGQPLLDPVEISHAVLWLSSDAAKYVTGSPIVVDAGFLIK